MKKIVIITIASVLLLLSLPSIISSLINDISLNIFSHQLCVCPLPQKSEYIEQKQVCGKLNGCGNGMDFFACILIKSDMSLDKLNEYYDNTEFKQAKPDYYKHSVEEEVVQIQGYELNSDFNEHAEIQFESLKDKIDFTGYYVIIIFDGGYPADFDLRGH